MIEFEKWYDEYSYWGEIDAEGLPLQISKDTWHAALKWVLGITEGAFMPQRYAIEQELKNLNQSDSQGNDSS